MTSLLTNFIDYLSPLSILSQSFPPPSRFNVSDIPDLSGKVILVTGCAGIGYETIKACLEHGGKVYVGARSRGKAEKAIEELFSQTGKQAIFLQLDLGDLKSVKTAAEEFLSQETQLDVLFLNAGVMNLSKEILSAQGYDMQFATNVLGHAYLSKLLLPALFKATEKTGTKARIVSVSSDGHVLMAPRQGIVFPAISPGPERDALSPSTLYGMSKFGNVVWAQWLHNHYGDRVVATSCHPGHIRSDLVKIDNYYLKLLIKTLTSPLTYPTPQGALTQLYAGLAEETEGMGGKYFVPWAREATKTVDPKCLEVGMQERLDAFLEEAIKGM